MDKTWRLRRHDPEISRSLAKHLAISPLAAQILSNRGVSTPKDGERFIRPSLSHLHDPFLMKDMEKAVNRMMKAIDKRENVLIYGDYDADGITSTAILTAFLNDLGAMVRYYIPHRITEGYGLNIDAIRRFADEGLHLLVTADCGVSSDHEIHEAGRLGIDTIVIDHHEPPAELPLAEAILNPKRRDCHFPFDGLSGVGVAFKLLIGLRAKLRERGFWRPGRSPNLRKYLDLVSLGTIADLAPLVDENRILVKFGLEELTKGERKGIKALIALSGLEGRAINTGHVAFQLAPRLNACGRLDHAGKAVDLLLTQSWNEARNIASELEHLNRRRQTLEDQIFGEILTTVERHPENLRRSCLFFSSRQWHPGVIGIVASRLVERFGMPSVLVAFKDDNFGRGSARGIEGLDLYQALKRCEAFLVGFGGHRGAAGFTVKSELVGELRDIFERTVSQERFEAAPAPSLYIDAEVTLDQIDRRLVKDLVRFEPHGVGNPRPLFLTKNAAVYDRRIVGTNSLKLRIGDRKTFDAIGFRMADRLSLASGPIDLVFTPQLNHWMGSHRIELEFKDLTPHEMGSESQGSGVGSQESE